MNVSYQWLRALLPDLPSTPEETAEILALRGAPVEELVHLAPGLEGLIVGRVVASDPHPGADRLSVCQVETGSGRPVQVVCGAPNIEVGRAYPFAPPGSRLPTGAGIEEVTIRGVESHGMLCSEAELELGPDAGGILALEGEPEAGTALTDALGLDDWRLDVEVTANRGDLLSHVGVARELAPAGADSVTLPPVPGGGGNPWGRQEGPSVGESSPDGPSRAASSPDGPSGAASSPDASLLPLVRGEEEASAHGVTVRVEAPELCSRYLGAVIRGVKVGPSPSWLAARIRAAGSRPINNVVDATNYVMMELGQPLHAFDLAKLREATIVVRRAREGELIRTLDGEDRRLAHEMLAICDASEPVAIAGVMGGADSEVSSETRDILLECALFNPGSVRNTRNALEMSTDASYRFERGVDPEGMDRAVARAVEIILATAGGTPDASVLDACPRPWSDLTVPLRPSRVEKLLGITLPVAEIEALLAPLGFQVVGRSEERVEFAVPGFRSYDVRREVDLLEEVARTYGFDRFPSELGPFRPGTVPDHPLFQLEDELRNLLAGEGFLEAQTMAFAPEPEGEVELSNPVSMEEGFLRTALLPGLCRRVEYNFARGLRDVRLFELGTVFFREEGEETPREEARLCVVCTGSESPLHWKEDPQELDLWLSLIHI